MKVREVMISPVVCVGPGQSVESAAKVLGRYNIGALPVCTASGMLCGMITDRDLVTRCIASGKDPKKTQVGEVMTGGIVWATPEMDAAAAARLMGRKQIRRLPVIESRTLCGMVSLGDLACRENCAMDAADALEETAVKEEEKTEEKVTDGDPIEGIMETLKAINDRLDKIEAEKTVEEIKEEKDPFDEALEELKPQEEKGGEEAVVVPAEEMDGCGKAVDAADLINAVRPAVSAITDEAQRKAVTDALIGAIKKPGTDLGKVMDATASHAEKVHTVDTEEIQNAYANMNPHTRKEDK
jgi:CBS domain-containing protein